MHYAFFEYAGSNITHYLLDRELSGETDIGKDIEKIKARFLSNKMLLLADYDIGTDDKSDKNFKLERQSTLKEISQEGFIFLTTEPCKEIENLLSPAILKKVVKQLKPSDRDLQNEDVQNWQLEFEQYRTVGIGKYLQDQINAFPPAAVAQSGTLSNDYKLKLANIVFADTSITWEDLSEEARQLTRDIYAFIRSSNQ